MKGFSFFLFLNERKYLHGTIGRDAVLQAVELPAGVTDLDTGLIKRIVDEDVSYKQVSESVFCICKMMMMTRRPTRVMNVARR